RFLGDAASSAPLLELGLKPALGQVKPALQKRVAFGAGVAQEDAQLAMDPLAQRPALLPSHSDEGWSLFGERLGVDTPDSLRITQSLRGQLPVSLGQPRLIPPIVGQEPLEIAHLRGVLQPPAERSELLSFGLAQPLLQVQFQPLPELNSPKGRVEQSAEGAQLWADPG